MPRSRGFRSQTISAHAKRRTGWDEGPQGVVSTTTNNVNVFSIAQIATEDGLTVVRTLGDLLVRLTTSDAITSGFNWGFGMCIVSQNAAGVGASAIPAPLDDVAWEGWFVHHQGTCKGTISVGEGPAAVRVAINSKAMRKLGETDTIVAMFQSENEVGAATLNADLVSRILLKLP